MPADADQPVAEELHGVEKDFGLGGQVLLEVGLALVVEDVGEHASGVQIDASVESVWSFVDAHLVASVVTGRPSRIVVGYVP